MRALGNATLTAAAAEVFCDKTPLPHGIPALTKTVFTGPLSHKIDFIV